MPKWIMVLPEGTYAALDGCAIVAVPNDMPDEDIDQFIRDADGYYCFTDQPTELEGNNGQTMTDLAKQDYDYYMQQARGRKERKGL